MAGGNSHQRAVEKAAKARMAEEVTKAVLRELQESPGPNMPISTTETEAKKSFWTRLFGFLENPLTLGALFLLGGIVGTILFTPAFVVCALCILLGFHRAGVVADQSRRVQVVVFVALALIISIGGYFLYGLLDSALQKVQTDFAKKVASFINTPQESPIVSSQPIEAQMYSGDILTFPQPNHKCMGYHIFLDTPTDHNGKSTSVASLHLVVSFPELVRDYRVYSFVVAGFDHTGPVESGVVYTKAAGCHFNLEPTTLSANIHSSFIVPSNEFSVVASPFEGFLEAEFLTDPSTAEPKASGFHTLVSAPEKIEASGQYQQKPTDPLTDITFAFKDKRDLWWGVPKAPEAQH